MEQPDPLIERVDALLRRSRDAATPEADVPVLTEVVEGAPAPRPVRYDPAALEALARELERAVLERLGPEVDRVVEAQLARTLQALLGQAIEGVRAELTVSVTQMVREAVATSVARALGQPQPPRSPSPD